MAIFNGSAGLLHFMVVLKGKVPLVEAKGATSSNDKMLNITGMVRVLFFSETPRIVWQKIRCFEGDYGKFRRF